MFHLNHQNPFGPMVESYLFIAPPISDYLWSYHLFSSQKPWEEDVYEVSFGSGKELKLDHAIQSC